MNGIVTEIQRFSLNDGPGIRTTVFLKGCNMKCPWCHNPETISPRREVHYYERNCIGCYKCVTACPSKAHKKIGGVHHFYPNLCVRCGKCTDLCFAGAMAMSGTVMTPEEAMAEILEDKAYYEDSKGGVTISGGEVLCQREFASELAEECRKEGIPVAVETNLSMDFEEIRPLLERLDCIMCDLKLFSSEEHRKWTGMGNETIKENIQRLSGLGIPFIVRTPLIPGVTDGDENIREIAEFLKGVEGLAYYELLNFNPLGEAKYRSLCRENPFREARPLSEARVEELAQLARQSHITVRVQ